METLAHSESFYIFASIALIVVAVVVIILVCLATYIAYKVKKIISIVELQVSNISDDIDDVRAGVKEKSEKFGGILHALIGAFFVKKAVTRKRKK
jgi:cell division protein FtsL